MKSQKHPAGQICCEVVGLFHVKEAGEVGEGWRHWRVSREKGYHLTFSMTALECRGQGRKQGGELGVVVEIRVRNGLDPAGWAVTVVRGGRAWLCVRAAAGMMS